MIEAPELMKLSKAGLPIWGIAYKDTAVAATGFLDKHGDPYQRIAADAPGRVAIDWGVYGVAGPITPEIADEQLRPLLRSLT